MTLREAIQKGLTHFDPKTGTWHDTPKGPNVPGQCPCPTKKLPGGSSHE